MRKKSKSNSHSQNTTAVSEDVKTLQSIISCLFYLCKEAEKQKILYACFVLKEAISKIDLLSRGQFAIVPTKEIIDDSLYEAMNFLHKLADMSDAERSDFMNVYNKLRETIVTRGKKSRPQEVRRTLQ